MKNLKQVQDAAMAVLISTLLGVIIIALMCGICYSYAFSMWVWVSIFMLWTICTAIGIYVESRDEADQLKPFAQETAQPKQLPSPPQTVQLYPCVECRREVCLEPMQFCSHNCRVDAMH